MKIYTKTGDLGESSLFNGARKRKDDRVFNALGDVDELNSAVGVAREFCEEVKGGEGVASQLETVQTYLLDVGSACATPITSSTPEKLRRVQFDSELVQILEEWIDSMDEELPTLSQFILPSGGKAASFLHLARAVCRRAERSVVPLIDSSDVEDSVGKFLNRLSDYLFTAARWMAMKSGHPEKVYKKSKLATG
ncbi:unnamed protein product [Ostreobium quekettii]|uniref:Corrinoid adenosyltransferase MMAB n=1 Tax=Ostreobium quekettii TaxID=121088 RepID=A0A8S1JDE5_9CHLO|nr:unnamed protein product [Ostreobium quekettii]